MNLGLYRSSLTFRDGIIALGLIIAINAVGALPAVFVGSDTEWIERPWFYPPEILFPIVWTLLFMLMGIALFLIWRQGRTTQDAKLAYLTFGVQFGLNLIWTPIFFGLQRPGLALIVLGLLWIAIIATIVTFDRISRIAAGLLLPYWIWVSFAFVLNYAIYVAS